MSALILRPAGPRRLDLGDRGVDLAPVGAADLLQVVDFRRRPRAARNFDQLVDAFQEPVAFGPHVADVAAAAPRRLGRQRDQFVGLGKAAGG